MDIDPTNEAAPDEARDESNGGDATFRLLISDMPANIDDFNHLNVTFGTARIFGGGEGGLSGDELVNDSNDTDESNASTNGTAANSLDAVSGETNVDTDGENGTGVQRQRGFYLLDLNNSTVDLTEVIGIKAMSVFEGVLSEGMYNKIELNVTAIEGTLVTIQRM